MEIPDPTFSVEYGGNGSSDITFKEVIITRED